MLITLDSVNRIEACIMVDGKHLAARAFHYRGRGWFLYDAAYRDLGWARWKKDILVTYALGCGQWIPAEYGMQFDAFAPCGSCGNFPILYLGWN